MTRRQFAAGLATTIAATPLLRAQKYSKASQLARIGVMSFNFNSIMKQPAQLEGPNRTLDALGFAEAMADHYGIHRVEFQHDHFMSTEPDYLMELKNRVKKAKSSIHQINLEFDSPAALNISLTQPVIKLETIDLTKRWIDIAAFIGCDYVMLNQGTLTTETLPLAIDSCKKIVAYGKTKKVGVSIENRGGGGGGGRGAAGRAPGAPGAAGATPPAAAAAAPPQGRAGAPATNASELLLELFKQSGIRPNPDMSGGPDLMRQMFALNPSGCHARSGATLAEIIKISREANYQGTFSIEGGGGGGGGGRRAGAPGAPGAAGAAPAGAAAPGAVPAGAAAAAPAGARGGAPPDPFAGVKTIVDAVVEALTA
jgi:hypothetical protein